MTLVQFCPNNDNFRWALFFMLLIIKPNTKISFFDKIGQDLGLVDLVDCMFVKKLIASPRFHAIALETQPHTLDLRLESL